MTWSFVDDYLGPSRYVKLADQYHFDMEELETDQHYITFSLKDSSLSASDVYVYTLDKDCVGCPYTFFDKDATNITATDLEFRIATKYVQYFPQGDSDGVICDLDPHFGQHGVYNININRTYCEIDILQNPVNIYSPILTVCLIYFLIIAMVYGLLRLYRKLTTPKIVIQHEDDLKQTHEPKKTKSRVKAIDTFRGIAMVYMIFSNSGDGEYRLMGHIPWNGLHIADLIFPWFMWIMGACIPISLNASFNRGVPNRTLVFKVIKRSIKLFLLGFLQSHGNLYSIRICGILQRFAVCYLVVSIICIYFMKRHVFFDEKSKLRYFEDLLKLQFGWIIVILLVVIHTILIFVVHEPGCPRGYFGPGGLHNNGLYGRCTGGATGYIDRQILGRNIHQTPYLVYEIYGAKRFDKEGLVGCLTTIFTVFIGVQAGTILLVYKKDADRIIRWLSWAVVTGIIGGALCGFSKENGIIPINKSLWSLSFVMVTSSFAFCLLTFCYVLIDIKKWWSGKPLIFAGMNAIVIYVGHRLCHNRFPIRWYYYDGYGNWRKTHFISFLSDTWATGIWMLFAYYLYRRQYFLKV